MNGITILTGDCRETLKTLPDGSVHCVVTSPPYFGLQDYGTGTWEGGDPECDHLGEPFRTKAKVNEHTGTGVDVKNTVDRQPMKSPCAKCGAIRVDKQIGLEPTPQEFVEAIVTVFREVRRVLRDDGVCWINLGDSYAGSRSGSLEGSTLQGSQKSQAVSRAATTSRRRDRVSVPRSDLKQKDMKPKDLIGIPWMVAFALRQPYRNWQIKDEAMRAWVGGIVDGEGCITILKTKSSHSDSLSYPPVIQVRMCDIEPLDRLVQVVGSSYGKPQKPPSQVAANQRQSWQWKVVSEQAANVISEIYPFLTCKRKQAIVAWNHQAFRAARGNQSRQQGDIEKEQFCKTLINQLNQREQVDIPSWMKEPKVVMEPGWYLRQDCIWHKPNPMPESVTDRCTKSHEYVFLLTKSARYFFDSIAIQEPVSGTANPRGNGLNPKSKKNAPGAKQNESFSGAINGMVADRNKRSVWTVSTRSYKGAHFATFPPALIEPCILAGTSEHGCCPKCGAPWERVLEKERVATRPGNETKVGRVSDDPGSPYEQHSGMIVGNRDPQRHCTTTKTIGWEPTCECGAELEPVPCTVLDPFNGSGTTGEVARKCGCHYIGCELNPEYVELTKKRLQQGSLLV